MSPAYSQFIYLFVLSVPDASSVPASLHPLMQLSLMHHLSHDAS
jgi:hypothetical protein